MNPMQLDMVGGRVSKTNSDRILDKLDAYIGSGKAPFRIRVHPKDLESIVRGIGSDNYRGHQLVPYEE